MVINIYVYIIGQVLPRCFVSAPLLAKRFVEIQESASKFAMVQPYIPEEARQVDTPFKAEAWEKALEGHQNRQWVNHLVNGVRCGVRIGYDYTRPFRSAKNNCPSSMEKSEVVDAYLNSELVKKHIAGPFRRKSFIGCMANRFGVIPKSTSGKWRLIVDLSFPEKVSINDGISKVSASMVYSSVEDAARMLWQAGKGALMAKIDVANAFRNVPVHPDDRHLLGMVWRDKSYFDKQVPFGLRSAPVLFNAYADALEWIVRANGCQNILHYLDDFLVVGRPATDECSKYLEILISTCTMLGVPLAEDKIEGPETRLTFLGIEIDSERQIASLPSTKLSKIKDELRKWSSKKAATRRELEKLLGLLNFACKVIPQGRCFLRRMFDTLSIANKKHHFIRLNVGFRSDLAWWSTFCERWNGVGFLHLAHMVVPSITFSSDASGTWGCGALWQSQWIQGSWDSSWQDVSIMIKELIPIVLAAAIWGPSWSNHHVLCQCDNMAVVQAIRKGSSKEPSGIVMHLLRCLTFFTAIFQFTLTADHLSGIENGPADSISRNKLNLFFTQVPQAEKSPTVIPDSLWQMLVTHRPDWLSKDWKRMLINSLGKEYQSLPGDATILA